jgi:chemotaxis protein CheZ
MTDVNFPIAEPPIPAAGLVQELEGLTAFVSKVRNELSAIRPDAIRALHIPRAADHLDAVVHTTEVAANQILDACELLEKVAAEVPGPAAERIGHAVTMIYEACNFHDLTGQRVRKVVNTLDYIESRLGDLVNMLGMSKVDVDLSAEDEPAASDTDPMAAALAGEITDASLLNGPQLPGAGVDQSEVDRLLNA